MNDDSEIIIFIILIAFAVWFFYQRHQEALRQEELKKLEAERLKHRQFIAEQQMKTKPAFVLQAMKDFEQEYRIHGTSFFSRNEVSPLKYYGYTVGKTKGLSQQDRHLVMSITYYAELPDIFPPDYKKKWGDAGTFKRYERILQHIRALADQRRGNSSFKVAVSHWDEDRRWFVESHCGVALKRKACGL